MADEQTAPTEEIEVGSFFLETLTTGMYEEPLHCIREYVQNAYDAIGDAVRAGFIKKETGNILITIGGTDRGRSITVRDNGTGVPVNRAYRTLVSLGASRKNPNLHAGFRGIGRLAGIAYCGTLRFKTKAKGETVGTVIAYDCGKIRSYLKPGAEPQDVREVIRGAVSRSTFEAAADEHYTEVEMDGLTNVGLEFTDLEKLHPYLSQVCPVAYADQFDYSDRIGALAASYGDYLGVVQVETRVKRERFQIHKPYKNEAAAGKVGKRGGPAKLHDIETFTSKEHGWYGWIGVSQFPGEITDDTVAGVRFRMKNIQVGDALIMMDLAEQLTETGSERRLPRWTVGEIFITNPEIVPNARRDGFEDTPAWRSASTEIKDTVAARIVRLVRNASSSRSAFKSAFGFLEDVKTALETPPLPAAKKAKFERKLKGLIEKFSSGRVVGPDPKEISSLISALKELQEQLAKALVAESSKLPPTTSPSPVANLEGDGSTNPPPVRDLEETAEPDVLDIVYEVLTEELGDEEAERLMDIIIARVSGE